MFCVHTQDPVQVRVGKAHYVTRFSGSKRQKVLKSDFFYYIPLEKTLKQLLQQPDILGEIDNFHGSRDDILRDMCDGDMFKKHPLFSTDEKAIQIIAYYDEVELCNPLGSNTKIHKLGCVFFTLGNFHPCYRSWLKSIFLVAVATGPTIKAHGIDDFFRPFVEDVKSLSTDGLQCVLHNGEKRHFQLGMVVFLADNLAAHAIGGFKESMSFAFRICRSCMATTEEAQRYFEESYFELRTAEKHKEQCQLLEGASTSQHSVDSGINRKSILETIPNFSVANNLPHDIMHDLFEGVVSHEMKLLLKHCVDMKFFTIPLLNARLQNFDFGYTEISDKPSELGDDITKIAKIRQSASKMWLLATIFPFLVGDLISETDRHWTCFLILLKICEVCAAWSISSDTAAYLRVIIEEHHTLFKTLYPDNPIIPKMHYMVHYPSQMMQFGPLIHTWTMRHEAKLSVLKRAAHHGNFKNISLTVAKRHQHLLCYHLNIGRSFLARDTEVSTTGFTNDISSESVEFQRVCPHGEETIHHPKWVKYGSLHLKPHVYLYLGSGSLYPIFGKVIDILVSGAHIFVKVMDCDTICFESHYNAFVIELQHACTFYSVQCLPFYPVLHCRKSFCKTNNKLYLNLKHFIKL